MTRKKIAEFTNEEGTLKACVYRDTEWQEYRVTFYRDGIKQADADHHTDDKRNALDTAAYFAFPAITPTHRAALTTWKETHGAKWKDRLYAAWWIGEYPYTSNSNASLLHQLRNICGPSWLAAQPTRGNA